MIAGDRCTRACGFCAVSTAKPLALEADEPDARGRGDPADEIEARRHHGGGARRFEGRRRGSFPQTIEAVRELNPGIVIEVLVPDFNDQRRPSKPCWRRTRTFSITTWKPCGA
jgi:lipoyl synthase